MEEEEPEVEGVVIDTSSETAAQEEREYNVSSCH